MSGTLTITTPSIARAVQSTRGRDPAAATADAPKAGANAAAAGTTVRTPASAPSGAGHGGATPKTGADLSPQSKAVKEAVADAVQDAISSHDRSNVRVTHDVHEATGHYLIRVEDSSTGEIIREFPPMDYLDAVAALEDLAGLQVDGEM